MVSLREVGERVGVEQDSLGYGSTSPIGLRYAADVMAFADEGRRSTTLRGIAEALEGLPPITLEAELVSFRERRATIRLDPCDGLVIATRIIARNSAGATGGTDVNYGRAGGSFTVGYELGPGQWTLTARRTGVGPTGYVVLERAFSVVSPPDPGRQEPDPPAHQDIPPHIDVQPLRDDDRSYEVWFRITGSGFQPSMASTREGEGVFVQGVSRQNPQHRQPFWTSSDSEGRIDHTTGAIDVRGVPRDAAGIATLAFSAHDRRTVPPRNDPLWSNVVPIDV